MADGTPISPCAWRSRFALAEKGIAFESVPVMLTEIPTIGAGEHRTVPVLEVRGRYISDSWQIADYLDKVDTGPQLFGSPAERALAWFFDRWLADQVVSQLFRAYVGDIFDRVALEDRDYFRRTREARLQTSIEQAMADREKALAGARAALEPVRLSLLRSVFLSGDRAAYVDFMLASCFIWIGLVGTSPLLTRNDPIIPWLQRVLGHPAAVSIQSSLRELSC